MRIALCGGTFDPFHRGHLEPVLAVREELEWERIIYIPAYRQPFKNDVDTATAYDRYAMTVLGTSEHDEVSVSQIELLRGATSYTVDTLEELRVLHPRDEFDWIIGDDNLPKLLSWKSPERLFALARFVVLTRGGAEMTAALAPLEAAGRIIFARNQTVPISATDIRRRVRAGESIELFVDPLVSRYIHHNRLYREATI
jgi:nicotinate-nucleotide adenylyltransferase